MDDTILMIEADILFWKLTSDDTLEPVMGHYQTDQIDLSVSDFLDLVISSKVSLLGFLFLSVIVHLTNSAVQCHHNS